MRLFNNDQRGNITTEFAFALAFFIIPFLAGSFDVAKYVEIGHMLNRAAREGAVWAARDKDPAAIIENYIQQAGLEPELVTVTTTESGGSGGVGGEVMVDIVYAFQGYSIFPWQEFMPQGIQATATARRE